MAYIQQTKGRISVGGINVNGDIDLVGINNGTVSIDPGSIATVSTGTGVGTITGIATTDMILLHRPAGLNDDLVVSGWRITGANTLTVYLYNPTGGAIDDGALNWEYLHFALAATS